MKKNNCSIRYNDRLHYHVYNAQDCIEMFGLDYLEEYGKNLPIDLIERYTANLKEFNEIQTILRDLYETSTKR